MEFATGLLHGLELLATGLLAGALLYSRVVERGPDRGLARRLAVLALAASLAWTACATCRMCDSYRAGELWEALAGTRFGLYGVLKLAALAAVLTLLHRRKAAAAFWFGLSLPLLSGLAGHAGAQERPALGLVLDYAHFLAVAAWSGGLLSLSASPSASRAEVERFSRLALAAVAAIAATGALSAARFGVAWRAPWETGYGCLVLLKTALFCAALGGAAINRFVHMRARREDDGPGLARAMAGALRFELAAVALAFLAAGVLTGTSLPGE